MPFSAPLPVPTMMAVGVARPSAQGQAMMSTATKLSKANVREGSGPAKNQIMKDAIPYLIEQCFIIQLPSQYEYEFWQPWVKNYHGEVYVGYQRINDFCRYVWLDLDLKEDMTGTR